MATQLYIVARWIVGCPASQQLVFFFFFFQLLLSRKIKTTRGGAPRSVMYAISALVVERFAEPEPRPEDMENDYKGMFAG